MRHSLQLYIAIILIMIITSGTECAEHTRDENCATHTYNTSLFQFSIGNPVPVYHVLDTINIFSAISDTFHTLSSGDVVIPVDFLAAHILAYKIITSGTAFELSYANTQFNPIVTIGTFADYGNPTNNFIYQRLEPYNNLQVSFVPGDTGLYVFTLSQSNTQLISDEYYKGNDYCNVYKAVPFIPVSNQNAQYWDSLGISSLRLPTDETARIKREDQNYFFAKIVQ